LIGRINRRTVHDLKIRFVIEGLTYRVTPLDADPKVAVKAYRFQKLGHDGRPQVTYDVRLSPEGRAECECLGHLKHGRCKHVMTLRAAGMFPRVPNQLPSAEQ
jgi:hypothetical protein